MARFICARMCSAGGDEDYFPNTGYFLSTESFNSADLYTVASSIHGTLRSQRENDEFPGFDKNGDMVTLPEECPEPGVKKLYWTETKDIVRFSNENWCIFITVFYDE